VRKTAFEGLQNAMAPSEHAESAEVVGRNGCLMFAKNVARQWFGISVDNVQERMRGLARQGFPSGAKWT
jgi:hypothetical protein